MKKTILILSALILTGTGFYGCKKGANDPTISLHSRKGRLVNDWTLSAGTETNISGTTTDLITWSGTSVTETYTSGGTSSTSIGTGSYTMSILKDGTWKSDQSITWTGTPTFISKITSTGTWNWTGKVGELKNKSQVVFKTLTETDLFGSSTDTYSYTGDSGPTAIWNIDELKSKELIVIWEGTKLTTSGGTSTSSSNKGEYTWISGK
ncbi:MAG: hypothetical protein HY841_09765 [Bacteroidetes bacterium]|nr:hypothetical protein [Bacteroidota bacterium]